MSTTDRVDAIRTILDEHGGLGRPAADLAEDADLYDAGLTSFASVNVLLAIEDTFDIEFPEDRLNRPTFQSIDSLRQVVDELVDL